MGDRVRQLVENLSKTIVGKEDAIQLVLVALFSGGHALLEDVPGVGKTLLAKSLARCIDGTFQRVQCTPDLLPADITGTNIWNPSSGEFQFLPGPIFAHVLLTDEINRATPRTQSALLEVMEEHQMTLDGVSRPVPMPFFVIATQNPVEYQGTFPLPEAQMDRFALSFTLGYPSEAEETRMLDRLATPTRPQDLQPCITPDEVAAIQSQCAQVRVEDSVKQYLLALVRATREHPDITLGVSPRGSVAFYRAIQALAFLSDRDYVLPDDVKRLAPYVLAHRLIPAGGHQAAILIQNLLDGVPIPA
ncbi:MoxR family ATPase [Oscillatoria sp. CS-180]|uniref:AAA family ATPase n=1 Tax=Oscillatoria sp. CS-180 TaxID=3021720 RepID=UPI002330D543|nr:MoxR family ATPase [Oscillatoria sp. CS-180]MDB9527098.1 MoxR family ATPase [Oscillatoria sp. CS-180]